MDNSIKKIIVASVKNTLRTSGSNCKPVFTDDQVAILTKAIILAIEQYDSQKRV